MSNPTLAPRTQTVWLLQGEDQERLDELEATVNATAPPKGGDPSDEHEAAIAAAEEFKTEARGRAVAVVLRPVGRKTWRSLVNEHSPREGNEDDRAIGVNEDTFPDALVPASLASPVFPSDHDRDAFLDELSSAQFDRLYYTAFALNRTTGADPKARRL